MANRNLLLKERVKTQGATRPQGRAKRPALRAITGGKKTPHSRTYHVEWDAAEDHWTVFSDDGLTLGHAHDLGPATDLAIRAAMHDHGEGAEVIVCVQQKDGSSVLAWSPR